MLKKIFFIVAIFSITIGFSQEEDTYVFGDNTTNNASNSSSRGFDWERVTIGGGLGLSFGSLTVIDVAPAFGYYLTDNILAGMSGRYTYFKDNNQNYSTYIYGGSIYSEYLFNNVPLLAHVETEYVNLEWIQNERKSIVNFYVGGGFKQSFGGRSYIYILGLWNLNETKESYILQPNPIIRGGIAIGL